MAKADDSVKHLDTEAVVPQDELSSSEQAKANEHVASTPTAPVPDASAAKLTGHTTSPGIVDDADGRTVAVHDTTVVTDPEADNAVQIPDHPGVDGRLLNPLAVGKEKTPEQAFADGTAAVTEVQHADEPADEPKPADQSS